MRAVLPPLVLVLVLAGCTAKRTTAPVAASPSGALPSPVAELPTTKHPNLPRVVRRILAEEKELIAHSISLANEIPDPKGKERALAEARELDLAIDAIEAPIDGADSDALDTSVNQLIQLDTRIALLHDKLRTAANRRTALAPE